MSRRKRPGNSPGARASGPALDLCYERASRVNQLDVSIRLQREMRSYAVGGDRDPPKTMVDSFLDRRGPSTPTPRSRSTTCGLWMMSPTGRPVSLDSRVLDDVERPADAQQMPSSSATTMRFGYGRGLMNLRVRGEDGHERLFKALPGNRREKLFLYSILERMRTLHAQPDKV